VCLARCERGIERQTVAITQEMNLGAEATDRSRIGAIGRFVWSIVPISRCACSGAVCTDDGPIQRPLLPINGALSIGHCVPYLDAGCVPFWQTDQGPSWGDGAAAVHTGLDVAGLLPGVGAVPDAINAGLYAVEGDYGNAALSAAAAIPGIGDGATADSRPHI
jgi:hypothetical protein